MLPSNRLLRLNLPWSVFLCWPRIPLDLYEKRPYEKGRQKLGLVHLASVPLLWRTQR